MKFINNKNWYQFDAEAVTKRFGDGVTFVTELPLTLVSKDGKVKQRMPVALYKSDNPNRQLGHKTYLGLYQNSDKAFVIGRELEEIGTDRYVHGLLCSECRDVIYSMTRHDFQRCQCGQCFVDGGTDYFRYSGNRGNYYLGILDLLESKFHAQGESEYGRLFHLLEAQNESEKKNT